MIISKNKEYFNTYTTKLITLITFLFISTNSYADKPKVITIDYAYYNPVSLLMKDRGSLEKSFKKDNIKIRWVLSLGSNKALEYLNGGSIDFGISADDWLEISEIVVDAIIVPIKVLKNFFVFLNIIVMSF